MKVQLYIVCVYIRTYEADLFFVRVESNCYRWSEEEVRCDQNTLQFSVLLFWDLWPLLTPLFGSISSCAFKITWLSTKFFFLNAALCVFCKEGKLFKPSSQFLTHV